MERTYTVCVQVAQQDEDLLRDDRIVPQTIRQAFAGTAIRVIECEPEQPYGADVAPYKPHNDALNP
jgi:hypothetical protein